MSAYGTWVSEVMLQQTRVETVVDYFVKWMELFPTPKALAEADLEQVRYVLGCYCSPSKISVCGLIVFALQTVFPPHAFPITASTVSLLNLRTSPPNTAKLFFLHIWCPTSCLYVCSDHTVSCNVPSKISDSTFS